MGHEYNDMIDILSESINLTESMPMAREGLMGKHCFYSSNDRIMFNINYYFRGI